MAAAEASGSSSEDGCQVAAGAYANILKDLHSEEDDDIRTRIHRQQQVGGEHQQKWCSDFSLG